MKKKKTVLLSFLHGDTKGLRHINISLFFITPPTTPPGSWSASRWVKALNPPWVRWDMQGRGRGVLLLMTSVGELRLSRKPDFKGANERRETRQTQAGITCQNREWAEGVWGSRLLNIKGLGFKVKSDALKHRQRDTWVLKSTYNDCTVQTYSTLSPFEACRTLFVMYN